VLNWAFDGTFDICYEYWAETGAVLALGCAGWAAGYLVICMGFLITNLFDLV
jgi:hypothetical protein